MQPCVASVWIEPLWNWNTGVFGFAPRYALFELNLYGIEINIKVASENLSYMFELNLYGIEIGEQNYIWPFKFCLNWTFMELKCVSNITNATSSEVWIEPLWNWNKVFYSNIAWMFGLNWTFMELKYPMLAASQAALMRLNWTFMELKLRLALWTNDLMNVWIEPLWNWNREYYSVLLVFICLNWTFMELKSIQGRGVRKSSIVWIEPLWNWNLVFVDMHLRFSLSLNWTFMELKFDQIAQFSDLETCLNWTFMELKLLSVTLILISRFRLNWTFMELKYAMNVCNILSMSVWIEPLWNWNPYFLLIDISQ